MRKVRKALSLLALAHGIRGDTLPYNPTRILLQANSSYAYIFGPSSPSDSQAQLSALDISESFSVADHKVISISGSLPFLQQDDLLPYTPSIDEGGNLNVVAGDCSEESDAQFWKFRTGLDESNSIGTWRQYTTSYTEKEDVSSSGFGYLANSIAFSESGSNGAKDLRIYVFGGMCPYANSTPGTWISRAEYSNAMLTLSPDASDMDIALMTTRGPPIEQAGSSITALPATYAVSSSGTTQSVQQDFVLLGGNTQGAFINMSQVAMFSLPQQSWSFIDVASPSNGKTDLSVRQVSQDVTPRSGHTAVVSEDGNRIVLFGGWVGDVNTPADPQLAILELGAGYGGSGDPRWTIPQQSGAGLQAGTGLYGHGATMLPGGVMMVLGGYEIPAASSKRAKRSTQTGNARMLLYNISSQSWIDSYDPLKSSTSSGPLGSTSAKVGLGTGLAIGAALLVTMVGFYLWYARRLKADQNDRERALLSYSSDGSMTGMLDQPFLSGGLDGRGGDRAAIGRSWPSVVGVNTLNRPRPSPRRQATGVWVDVPSPTRGLRRGSAGRYQYHAAPRYDDKRISRGSGLIHPIVEHENEDEQESVTGGASRDRLSDAEARLREVERVLNSQDPFVDPEPNPLGSHPIPSTAVLDTVRRVPTNAGQSSPYKPQWQSASDAPNWTVEDAPESAAHEEQDDAFPLIQGDDRTSSTLSEQSHHSTNTNNSITRTMSTKTGALLAAAAAAHNLGNSPQRSPTYERSNTVSTTASVQTGSQSRARALSSTQGSILGADSESLISASSNVVHPQLGHEVYVTARAANDPDDPYQRALAAHWSSTRSMARQLAAKSAPPPVIPPRRRPGGLMGSLRRALNVVSMGERSISLSMADEQGEEGARTSSSSPTKDRTSRTTSGPRRAVSDGGPLLRQKRGQKDWDEKQFEPYRDDPNEGDWGEPKPSTEMRQAEEDWDIESAAINRDFQVMFTVPKSKLRVVNDDMDRASLKSASDGGMSRNGSVRRDGSVKILKTRTNGDTLALPSTEEEKDGLDKDKTV